ncbi:hypothetical protein ACQEVZ_48880 [Dactylosporangium sp. CA-152071]|uniref:hypothetical protein n=1 Tax=Dactylosporangium sp. CA-152071 TaxID=3239933 RepID=UPI003D90638D
MAEDVHLGVLPHPPPARLGQEQPAGPAAQQLGEPPVRPSGQLGEIPSRQRATRGGEQAEHVRSWTGAAEQDLQVADQIMPDDRRRRRAGQRAYDGRITERMVPWDVVRQRWIGP